MKLIKTFEKFDETGLLLPAFEKYLPKKLLIIKQINDEIFRRNFSIGNIMRNANMTQTIYTADKPLYGHPDEMSIDIYYYNNSHLKLTFDIVYGDFLSCSFTIAPPNKVKVINYTSYHSKFDPSDTVFAFSDETIQSLCDFINMIQGFVVSPNDFKFLNSRDDFDPSA